MEKIFFKIFGDQIFENTLGGESSFDDNQKLLPEQIGRVSFWLEENLKQIDYNNASTKISTDDSKIVSDKVVFDGVDDHTLRISTDMLSIQSQGTFTSIKANACIYGGKYMYEVQLHSKGVMQIGWCSNKCTFTSDTGVGDTVYSYGYDGSKQQIWHVQTSKYGEKWQTGDIIGCCIDLDNEIIEYYRNGEPLGVAFYSIEKRPGIALFPAVSLAFNEALKANFGNFPFRYPVKSYQPIQPKPIEKLEKAEVLLGYTINLANILSKPKFRKDKKDKKAFKEGGKSNSKKTIYILISSLLIEKLAPVLSNQYVIEDKLFYYAMNLCVLRSEPDKDSVIQPGSVESTLGTLLSLFWSYMEEDEIKFILKKFLNVLLSMFIQTPKDLDYELQRKVIVVLTCICNHPQTRKFYIDYKCFDKNCLPLFLNLKPPSYNVMTQILPVDNVWTEGIGGSHQEYSKACDKLKKSVEVLYGLQCNLLKVLLTNDDGTTISSSSRKMFLQRLRKYVMENSVEQKTFFLLHSYVVNNIDPPVALSFLCILVDVIKMLFESELPNGSDFVDPKYFIDGTFRYQHYDRVGGVISHLRKVYHNDIISQLGNQTNTNTDESDLLGLDVNDVYSTTYMVSGNLNSISIVGRAQRQQPEPATPGDMDTKQSLNELLDLAIIYYYAVGHKHIVKIVAIRDEIAGLNDVLLETKIYRDDVEKSLKHLQKTNGSSFSAIHNEILTELETKFSRRDNVFALRSIELARKQAWYRAVALGENRRQTLLWLLSKTQKTLADSSNLGTLFGFVPEVYVNILPILLDTILDFSFHDIKVQYDVRDALAIIQETAEFLETHAADSRIILASCKDSVLQALGTLACHEGGMQALEQSSSTGQISLISALLRPYENRAWGQSNWFLLRFWLGDGYAFKESRPPSIWQGGNEPVSLGLCRNRAKNETHTGLLHHIAPAYPSKHFQLLIGKQLINDEPFATTFLNSVLSQLNWAFSEFILLLQEIQNTANRKQGQDVIFEPRQLKICSMCFELTVSLMRSLEMIIRVAPNIFLDSSRPNSDLLLTRICQLVSQVLSRVTVPPGCFQCVVDMCLPDLNTVTHFAIISAAVGILVALLKDEIDSTIKPEKISRTTRVILTDPSFKIANLEYSLGHVHSIATSDEENQPRGNFDPKTRAHIDPLTNDVRLPIPSTSKHIKAHPPILKFSLTDYPTHVSADEIAIVKRLIEMLQVKQTLLSDITLPSEDSLCPICCAKPISVIFSPCKHQSCKNCILQHLMTSKLCFYCKSLIKDVANLDGNVIFSNTSYIPLPT